MQRYVAIGDSTVEGLEDPGPDGVYVGWADRLARHLSAAHPGLLYANLAVRGLTAAEVRATQLEPALALRPDVAVVVAGVNDVLRPRFDVTALREDLHAMHARRDAGPSRADTTACRRALGEALAAMHEDGPRRVGQARPHRLPARTPESPRASAQHTPLSGRSRQAGEKTRCLASATASA